jgi:transcriptional regulator with XRE-family HTH domain
MDTLGDRLKLHRLMKKLSRVDFGKVFNLAETTIANYERNEREPNIKTIKQFADFFGVTTDYLLGHAPLSESATFFSMLDLTNEEIMSRCKLMLDGKEISEQEAFIFISTVRSLRDLTNRKDS